jgi:predicted nucleotidyltransferase
MTTKRYGRAGSGLLGTVLQTLPGKLASHWLVQGMAYMDPTERTFKLGLDAAGTVGFASLLATRLSLPRALAGGLLAAHTLNFLVNGHLRGALKWHGLGGASVPALQAELLRIARRLAANPAVEHAYVYGSVTRGDVHAGSDLDIRVLRRPGLAAGLAVCWLVLLERARSLGSGVPLDIYVWDSPARMERMRSDEVPLDLGELLVEQRGAMRG